MGHDTVDRGLQCHWRHCVSAPEMDECIDGHSANGTRRTSVLKGRDGKPWKTGGIEARAEGRVANEEF